MYFFQDSDYNIEDNETESADQVDHLLRPRNSMNPADGVTEQNIVIASNLEMEEENVLHSTEIVDLQLQEQQQGDLVYGDADDDIDANANNQSGGGESNHENDGENNDVAIEDHNYSALHINHLLLLCHSLNPLDGAILRTSANDLTLEIEEENVSHYPENVAFQLEGQRLDDLVMKMMAVMPMIMMMMMMIMVMMSMRTMRMMRGEMMMKIIMKVFTLQLKTKYHRLM